MQCPHCAAEIADDSGFCSECRAYLAAAPAAAVAPAEAAAEAGTSQDALPAAVTCSKCGAENPDERIWCASCGASLWKVRQGEEAPEAPEPAAPPAPAKQCPDCGAPIPVRRDRCERCEPRAAAVQAAAAAQRPGCVTAYVIVAAIGLAFLLVGSVILLAQSGQWFGAAATLAWCLTLIPVLVGLWGMRNWARVLVICLQALGLAFSGFSLLTGDYEGGGWRALATLVESGIIIGWFATHREEFLPPPGSDEAASSPALAIAALGAGLLCLVAWLAPFLGECVALAALVLGFLSRHSSRRGMAIAAMVLGAVGLVLAVGNVALGVVLSAPSNAVKDQLVAAETTRFAESKPGARVVKVTVDFGKAGSVTPEDRSNGVTQIRCYTAHTTFSEAEAVCEASLRHGVLALVDGQWDYDMYDAAGLDAWFEHDCAVGDVPLHVAPAVPCFTPAPAP